MATINYVGVTLPKSLIEEIDEIIIGKKGGYTSRAEFLKDSARQLLYKINGGENEKA